jgi:hypothetical protein
VASRSAALAFAFVAGSLTAWLNRERLLQVVAEPLTRSWLASPCSKHSVSYQVPSFVQSYSSIALTAAVLLALPFAAQLLAARSRAWPRIRPQIAGTAFITISYALEVLGIALVVRIAPPRLIARLIDTTGWCGQAYDPTSAIEGYVTRVCLLAIGAASVLQLCLVAAVFLLAPRSTPPSSGSTARR